MKKILSLILCLCMMLAVFSVCSAVVSAAEKEIAETGFVPVNLGDEFYAYIGTTNGTNRWITVDQTYGDIVADPSVNHPSQTWHFVRTGSCYKILDVIDDFNLKPVGMLFDSADVITSQYTDNNLWTIEQDGANYLIHTAVDQSYFLYEDIDSPEHRIRLASSASYKSNAVFKIMVAPLTNAMKVAPTVSIANAVSGVNLKWTAHAAIDNFRISKFNLQTEEWDTLTTTSGNSFTDTNVKSGVTYRYSVRGINPLYTVETIKTIKYLSMPKLLSVENTASGAVIKWQKVTGAARYRVFVRDGGWQPIGDTTGTSFTHTKCANNRSYTYTVRCVTANGNNFASAFDAAGITNTFYKSPTVKPTLKPNGYYLSWDKIGGVKKYRIFIKCKATSNKWVKVIDTANNYYFFSNTMKVAKFRMKHGESYQFTVRCMSNNCKTVLSGFTSTASVKYYDAPKITSINTGSTYNTVKWKSVKGAVRYRVFAWNGKRWIVKGTVTGTSLKAKKSGSAKQNKTYAVRALNSKGQYMTSYWETYDTGGNVYYYSPGVWTAKNKF